MNPFTPERLKRYKTAQRHSPHARRAELHAIEAFLQDAKIESILEIGSGNGFLTRWLLQRTDTVDTLDMTSDSAQGVRQHYQTQLQYRLPDELPSCAYDSVISLATFHHLAEHADELPGALLDSLHRVLKPGGRLNIIDVPSSADNWENLDEETCRSYELTLFFFEKIVDFHSQPKHNGVYLNTSAIVTQSQKIGWKAIKRQLLPCPWQFYSREELCYFLKTLFNLDNVEKMSYWHDYLDKAIVEKNHTFFLKWALSGICLEKLP